MTVIVLNNGSSSPWMPPADCGAGTVIQVEGWGAGSGASGGSSSFGAGGAGGDWTSILYEITSTDVSNGIPISIPAGGTGTGASNPAAGGDTTFGTKPSKNLYPNSTFLGQSGTALPPGWSTSGQGTLSVSVTGSGASDPTSGQPYIELTISGTTSTTAMYLIMSAYHSGIAVSTHYCLSTWLSATNKTNVTAFNLQMNMQSTAGSWVGQGAGNVTVGTSMAHVHVSNSTTYTTQAQSSEQLAVTFSSGVALNFVLRISGTQLESGTSPTTIQPTPLPYLLAKGGGAPSGTTGGKASNGGNNFGAQYIGAGFVGNAGGNGATHAQGGGGGGSAGKDGAGASSSSATGGTGDNGHGGAANTSNVEGGGGGSGVSVSGGTGNTGGSPGGGGGGETNTSSGTGGAGGAGQIRITYTPAATTISWNTSVPSAWTNSIQGNYSLPVEWQGTTQTAVSYDASVPLEILAAVAYSGPGTGAFSSGFSTGFKTSGTGNTVLEWLSVDEYLYVIPTEWQGTTETAVSYDARAPLEWMGHASLVSYVPAEHLSYSRSDSTVPAEHLAVDRSTWLSTADRTGNIVLDLSVPVQTTGPIRGGWTASVEQTGLLRSIDSIATEGLGFGFLRYPVSLEALQTVHPLVSVPLARIYSEYCQARLPIEILGTAQIAVSYDVPVPLEWLHSVSPIGLVPVEHAGQLLFTYPARIEHTGNDRSVTPVLAGRTGTARLASLSPVEHLTATRADSLLPFENTGSSLRLDAGVPVEHTVTSRPSVLASLEHAAKNYPTWVALVENLAVTRADSLLPAEHLISSPSEAAVPAERTGTDRLTSLALTESTGNERSVLLLRSEWLIGTKSDTPVTAELLVDLHYRAVVPMEWAGTAQVAVSYDVSTPLEWMTRVAPDSSAPIESSGPVRGLYNAPAEHLVAELLGRVSSPIEHTKAVGSAQKAPTEGLASVPHFNLAPVERLQAVRADVVLVGVDWLGAVRNGVETGVEALRSVAQAIKTGAEHLISIPSKVLSPVEKLGISAPVTPVPIEYLGAAIPIHYNVSASIEWLQTTKLAASSPAEFQMSVPSSYLVPIEWAGAPHNFQFPPGPTMAGFVIPWLSAPGTFVSGVVDIPIGAYPIPW